MNKMFVLLLMLFCHVIDDFVLQTNSPLANMKQKKWWEENAPQSLYKSDYLIALIIHSFSWAFMTMLPIAIYVQFKINGAFVVFLIVNTILHAVIDNEKANELSINLWTDQLIHIGQILATFGGLIYG